MNKLLMPSANELQDLASASYSLAQTGLQQPPKLVLKLAALADRSLKQIEENLACRPGCSWCCRRNIVVSTPEALTIFELVKEWPEDRLARLRECLRGFWQLAEPLRPKNFWDLREPCPFLDGEMCCNLRA